MLKFINDLFIRTCKKYACCINQGVGLCKHFPITRGKIQIRSTYLSNDLLKSNQLMTANEIIEIEKKEHEEELEYLKSKEREYHHSYRITV